MSRLTKKAKGLEHYTSIDGSLEGYWECIQKLGRLEDLEEQGRFPVLLCKPGDEVWCIEEDDYFGFLFMGMCGDYAIVCPTYTWCKTFDEQLECMVEETLEDGDIDVAVFHKSNVFLTEAEAEAKLAELKGGKND